ncbi:MAG: DUF255 domain-containing protein [gamma proteobacterium symbiont of Taylorina sp.]|nr:DUF255 domain-containing protein [gamma proteobacterium symbiont of Taylorina sp.]
MKNIVIMLTCLSIFYFLSSQANEPDWQVWSEDIPTQAKQNNRFILIDLTAQWCKFCKKMEQTTYKDQSVIDELNKNYIAIKADEEKYPELASRFKKVGRPGTIILDSNGQQLIAKTGYIKPQWMLWMLQGTIAEYQQ